MLKYTGTLKISESEMAEQSNHQPDCEGLKQKKSKSKSMAMYELFCLQVSKPVHEILLDEILSPYATSEDCPCWMLHREELAVMLAAAKSLPH